jgi:hypothetical protein
MTQVLVLLVVVLLLVATTSSSAFTSLLSPRMPMRSTGSTCTTSTSSFTASPTALCAGNNNDNNNDDQEDDSAADPEGADLAAQLFQMASRKGVTVGAGDLDDDDEDEEEDEDDEDDEDLELTLQQGGGVNVTLTNDQLYSEVKERVLDTAGGFVDFVQGAKDIDNDDDDNDDDIDDADDDDATPKPYESPTTVPDSDLTAGEVVLVVLEALLHNNIPTNNRGVELLFGYSSAGSQIRNEKSLTPTEYAEFLKETEYKVLFDHEETVVIDKGKYSYDGKKAYFTAKLRVGADVNSVNFILSSEGEGDDSCWMVDSILIRPPSMQRRRRR